MAAPATLPFCWEAGAELVGCACLFPVGGVLRPGAVVHGLCDRCRVDGRAIVDRLALGVVLAFAAEFATYFDVPFAVPVSSATIGLSIALGAAGIAPGDEVILPAISFR